MASTASRPYRSKTVKPCDACRRRRIACIRDNAEESCSLCKHRGQSCTFETAPQVRRNGGRRASRTPSRQLETSSPTELFLSRNRPRLEVSIGADRHIPSRDNDWLNGTTMFPDRTCLYSGGSSDQDPHLLRHLVYDERGCFGDDRWTVWRVGTQQGTPSYFTVFPNHHLDCHADMYSAEKVESLFSPYQDELIRLYYAYAHPSYPIISSRETFEIARVEARVPCSLLAVIYLLGVQFWHLSPMAHQGLQLSVRELRPWIFSCLAVESRTPNLAVIQATLLFMQLTPRFVRPPNHPGFWPMTCMLVGMAHDIGLHVDPTNWNISSEERKIRRILWWAVFTHDKWMSHSLGRPSTITSTSWSVAPLTLPDFSDEYGRLSIESISSANAFIALCNLSLILSDLSDTFYSVRSSFEKPLATEALEKAYLLLQKLQNWKEENTITTNDGHPYQYTVRIAAFSVRLSIQRAVFGICSEQQTIHSPTLAANIVASMNSDVFPVLDILKSIRPLGLWLSYSKGSLAIIGSTLITLVLASVEDADLEERQALLLGYRARLKALCELHAREGGCFEFTRLPLRRLNLIIQELFGVDSGDMESISARSDEEMEELIWGNYQISFQ